MWWKRCKPLDLLMTWSKMEQADLATFIVSGGISVFTGGGPSHVALHVEGGVIWEITFPKPRYAHLNAWDLNAYDVEIGFNWHVEHSPLFTPTHRNDLLAETRRVCNAGKTYDTWELAYHLIHALGIYSDDGSDPERWVCSSGVEHVFRSVGFGFRPQHALVAPEDIRESPEYCVRWQSWGQTATAAPLPPSTEETQGSFEGGVLSNLSWGR